MNTERIPPNNPEAERSFLACLIFDNKNIDTFVLDKSDFYNSLNALIYEAIQTIAKKRKVLNEILLLGLKPNKKLFDYCISLSLDDCIPDDGHVKYYHSLIKNCSIRRQQIELAYKIFNDAHNENINTDESVEQLKAILDKSKTLDETGIVTASDLFGKIDELYEKGLERGLSTGWLSLDDYYTVKPGQITVITGIPSHGKLLPLDTPLPTPYGWTTQGEVKVGDELFDECGNICKVTCLFPTQTDRPAYKITFSDGSTLVADAEHEWLTSTERSRRSERNTRKKNRLSIVRIKGTDQTHKRTFPRIIETQEIARTLKHNKKFNHAIDLSCPLTLPDRELPIDPYTLGYWLGNGNSNDGRITFGYKSKCQEEEKDYYKLKPFFEQAGFLVGKPQASTSSIKGLKERLSALYLLHNKHIHTVYKRASYNQRLALLQGLMDSAGHCTKVFNHNGRCEFTSMSKVLAEDFYELLMTLGIKGTQVQGQALLNNKDYGKKYRVFFTTIIPVFRLTRKLSNLPKKTKSSTLRYIVSCERVNNITGRCIEVDSPSHLYLVSKNFIPTHNSTWNTNLIVNMAQSHHWKFAVFSPENNPMQRYCAHMAQIYTGKPFGRGNNERITKEELEPTKFWIDEHFVFIVPRSDEMRIDNLIQKATICVLKHGVKGIVLDPWNEIDHTRPQGLSETEYISKCLSKLRYFARTYQVHVWLIAHPTKLLKRQDGTYPIPTPYDISGCYSDDTEVLTDKGWLLHDKIKYGDKICCFDTTKNELAYLDFSKKWEYDYQGNMINLSSPSFDLLITPNHKVVVKPDWRDKPSFKEKVKWNGIGRPPTHPTTGWSFIEAQDLKSDLRMPFATKLIDCSDYSITDDDLEIMGWWITKGWESMGSIAFCQATGILSNKMLEVAKSSGYIFTVKINKSKIVSEKPIQVIRFKNRYCKKTRVFTKMILSQCGIGCQNKKLPAFVWQLSFRQKQILFKALMEMEGDGSIGRGDSFRFATTSARLVDDVQRLSVELGRGASFSSQNGACEHHKRRYQINIGQTKRTTITLNMRRHKSIVPYHGKVYCLTVPTGAYIMRRNGKVSICGNSANFRNKADCCLTVWRDLDTASNETKIYIQKIRFHEVGKIGDVTLNYNPITQSYSC